MPMEMISMTEYGAESVTIDEETNQVSAPVQRGVSIEEMAFGVSSTKPNDPNSGFAPKPLQSLQCSKLCRRAILHELWK